MAALTAAEFKPAGTVDTGVCELCFTRFEFVHDGLSLPACCPTCWAAGQARRKAALAHPHQLSPEEEATFREIFALLGERF